MRLNKLRLIWEAGARLQVWQKRDGFRSLALGDSVEVDDVPVEDVEVMHGAFATALNLPCRPRTYEEMLAGHTRAGLRLIEDQSTGITREVWTLWVVDDNDTPEPRVSVHATERDAEDALRVNYAADRQDLEGDELFSHILRQGLRAGTERHVLA